MRAGVPVIFGILTTENMDQVGYLCLKSEHQYGNSCGLLTLLTVFVPCVEVA